MQLGHFSQKVVLGPSADIARLAPRQYAHLPYAHFFLCSLFMLIICQGSSLGPKGAYLFSVRLLRPGEPT
jgi:hypothetical protein